MSAAVMARLSARPAGVGRWCAVSVDMPDAETSVLLACGPEDADPIIGYHDGEDWRDQSWGARVNGVTHWQHLPVAPCDEEPEMKGGAA